MKNDEEILVVSENPLILIIPLPDGCDPGKWEAAETFAKLIADVYRKYPNHKLQSIPFSYLGYESHGNQKSALQSLMMIQQL